MQLEDAVLEEQRQLDEMHSGKAKVEQFMALIERYRDCTEYSDEILRQFVEKVVVHETTKDEDGERSRAAHRAFARRAKISGGVEKAKNPCKK